MKIIPKVQAVMFAKSEDKHTNKIYQDHGADALMLQVKEFNLVKKVLKNCAIEYGEQELMYTNILRSILREMKMTYKMRVFTKNYKPNRQREVSNDQKVFIEPLLDKKEDQLEDNGLIPVTFVKGFFTISVREVHEAIKAFKGNEMSIDIV